RSASPVGRLPLTHAPACPGRACFRVPPRTPRRVGSANERPRNGGAVRVLGIDPGLPRRGIGVLDGAVRAPLPMVAAVAGRTLADEQLPARLLGIEKGIEQWLDEYQRDAVAVERVFAQHNVRTVMGTAQASAIAVVCAARRGLPVSLHTPSEVKAAITGSGRADKAQVGTMVARILRLDSPPRPADAADAVALAICYLWRGSAQERIARARQKFARTIELARQRHGL